MCELSLKDFSSALCTELEKLFDGCKVSITETLKVNDVKKTAVILQKDGVNLGMTLYTDEIYVHYKNGESIEEIAVRLHRNYASYIAERSVDTNLFHDFKAIKDNIYCRLLNKQLSNELLETLPYRDFLDLALVYYLEVELPELQTGTVLINNSMIKGWSDVSEKTLYNIAISNLSKKTYIVEDMFELVKSLGYLDSAVTDDLELDIAEMQNNCNMHILRYTDISFGSSVLLSKECLEECAKIYGGDFFILPSSVFELIAIPMIAQDTDWQENLQGLRDMVSSVNNTQVKDTEILSYNIYKYCTASKSLVVL